MIHGITDMRKMGGLAKTFTKTHWLFLIGVLAMSGIPPFAAFFQQRPDLGRGVCIWPPYPFLRRVGHLHFDEHLLNARLCPDLSWQRAGEGS